MYTPTFYQSHACDVCGRKAANVITSRRDFADTFVDGESGSGMWVGAGKREIHGEKCGGKMTQA
jgi:hypothetical protein